MLPPLEAFRREEPAPDDLVPLSRSQIRLFPGTQVSLKFRAWSCFVSRLAPSLWDIVEGRNLPLQRQATAGCPSRSSPPPAASLSQHRGNETGNQLRQFLIGTGVGKVRGTFTMHDKGEGKKARWD